MRAARNGTSAKENQVIVWIGGSEANLHILMREARNGTSAKENRVSMERWQ